MTKKIRPLHDRVIVRPSEEETKSKGGILIPDNANKEKPIMGEILAVGPGKKLENGEIRKLDVKIGDKVLFGKYAGTEIKFDEDTMLVMREEDLMGVVEA